VLFAFAACGCDNPAPRRPRDAGTRPVDTGGYDASTDADADAATAADADAAGDAGHVPPPNLARNIIVFMGDGMGPEHLATGRFAKDGRLRIDAMVGPALAVTDSLTTRRIGGTDPPPTDSAAGATVIATGQLVENDVLSVGPAGMPFETVLELAQRAGKATGLVTTSMFFDASPAAFASHQQSRSSYPQIAVEILGVTQPDVVMGAGAWLVDNLDTGVLQAAEQSGYAIVRGAAELEAWDPTKDPRVLGLFETRFVPKVAGAESFTMTPALERTPEALDPTFATMTRRALERLSSAPDGFFLFAEDELFDQISHRGPAEVEWANRALPAQAIGFDAAVEVAIDWVLDHSSFEETLIVVLADHETGGYHFDPAIGPESGYFGAYVTYAEGLRVGSHTRNPIEVYALGAGSERVKYITQHSDTYALLIGTL